MNFDFARAMRAAARLTRPKRLGDATRLIQSALRRGEEAPPAPEQTIENENRTEHAPAKTEHGPTQHRFGANVPLDRPVRSIADTIKALRSARRFGGAAGASATRTPLSIPEGAQFLTGSFSASAGSRDYKLYLPRNRETRGLPLVVMLHGCTQNPDDFALGTGMNELAEEFGLVVAYPAQAKTANPSACWNWFAPKDQIRGSGEPSIIAGLTNRLVEEYELDQSRVFVAGMSAGGAMASVMAATYADVYAAVGVHSGLPYRAASDVVSAFAAMRGDTESGNDALVGVRTIVFHGEADGTVHPSNGSRLLAAHRSSAGHASEEEWGSAGGRSYVRTIVRDNDGSSRAEHWSVRGAQHAWSGGNSAGSFVDSEGPNASREMIRFFLERRG